jgi:hypothetical protein
MRFSRALAFLLCAALSAPAAHSQCAEPSALDVSPGSEPLRVQKTGRDLRISWEPVMADGFRLQRGRLDRLFANATYNHRVIEETTETESTRDDFIGDWYFLVNSTCRAGDSGVGRDSGMVERPHGGLISVRVGVQGGMGVSGSQFHLHHPVAEAFTDDDGVSFLGPYAPGAPGTTFGGINTTMEGVVIVVLALLPGGPDSTFDPPPDTPLDITEVVFGYYGLPPLESAFFLSNCSVSDEFGSPVPETTCSISGFDVLF